MKDRAYAKINLALDVFNVRDDGYHDIKSIMIPINFYDELEIRVVDNDEYICNKPYIKFNEKNSIIKMIDIVKDKYNINDLRSKLGLDVQEYSTMSNFKSNVLDKAVAEINKHTNIHLNYEQFKKGRIITDIQFLIKSKPLPSRQKAIKKAEKTFHEMSDAQVNIFGNQLSRLHELSHLASEGESYEILASRIKDMLRDPKQQVVLLPHLKNLGFKI